MNERGWKERSDTRILFAVREAVEIRLFENHRAATNCLDIRVKKIGYIQRR